MIRIGGGATQEVMTPMHCHKTLHPRQMMLLSKLAMRKAMRTYKRAGMVLRMKKTCVNVTHQELSVVICLLPLQQGEQLRKV